MTGPYPHPEKLEQALEANGVAPESLNDITSDGGGQRTEVGGPYDKKGGVARGVEKELQEQLPSDRERP